MNIEATDEENKTVKSAIKRARQYGKNISFNNALKELRSIRNKNDSLLIGYSRVANIDGLAIYKKK